MSGSHGRIDRGGLTRVGRRKKGKLLTPTQVPGLAPAQGPGLGTTQGQGLCPTQGQGLAPTKGQGLTPTQVPGLGPAQGPGLGTTQGQGIDPPCTSLSAWDASSLRESTSESLPLQGLGTTQATHAPLPLDHVPVVAAVVEMMAYPTNSPQEERISLEFTEEDATVGVN